MINMSKHMVMNNEFSECNMVMTPINKNIKSRSNRDYQEQMERIKTGKQHVWDDSKDNLAIPGDLFAYVENCTKINENEKTNGCVRIYRITNVLKPTHRLPTWSDNVGQGDRNVVELSSEEIYKGSMKLFKECMGYSEKYNLQGTRYIKNNSLEIYFDRIFTLEQIK
jgi:hypothetical protein